MKIHVDENINKLSKVDLVLKALGEIQEKNKSSKGDTFKYDVSQYKQK